MLVDFRIKNFALIDELEINFKRGLNILTGETGAGKSIIIGALEILLGARASTDIIRHGKETAYIEAVFEPQKINVINQYLQGVGIEPESGMILLSREIRENGRNRNRINGQLATAGMIKEISKYLVDIHGQHEHQLLLDFRAHLNLLDDFIVFEEDALKKCVAELYQEIINYKKKLAEYSIDEAEKARQIDLLEFQIEEINSADLKKNEIEELDQEFKVLTNIEEIYEITGRLLNSITGNDYTTSGLMDVIGTHMKELDEIKNYGDRLADFYKIINDVFYQLEDLGYQINNYHDNLEFDQERLDIIERRISLITGLQRKYGNNIEEILNYRDTMQKKLDSLKEHDKIIQGINEKIAKLTEEYLIQARKLSKIRREKAKDMENLMSRELADLAMKDTRFKINFEEKIPQEDGIDRVEFLISPNPGEELKPLIKIASGGELSRIMLALKTIISHIDQVDTLIFDEVDSGVGGKTAQKMAEKLAIISKQRQVLCITHLPQIASMSDCHLFITKKIENEHTYTDIYPLDRDGQKEELARMIGGVEMTAITLKHADEMLDMAEEKKNSL